MSNDSAEAGRNADVAPTTEQQMIEPNVSDIPTTTTEIPTVVRPWTADFLLPSVSFRLRERC
jgi:hypothetical protein